MHLQHIRQVTHVFALSAAFGLLFAMYCGNILDDKLSDIIDDLRSLLTPQINYYGNYNNLPYFY